MEYLITIRDSEGYTYELSYGVAFTEPGKPKKWVRRAMATAHEIGGQFKLEPASAIRSTHV